MTLRCRARLIFSFFSAGLLALSVDGAVPDTTNEDEEEDDTGRDDAATMEEVEEAERAASALTGVLADLLEEQTASGAAVQAAVPQQQQQPPSFYPSVAKPAALSSENKTQFAAALATIAIGRKMTKDGFLLHYIA
jgi:hypothetical protein